jgi:hypothetical protein
MYRADVQLIVVDPTGAQWPFAGAPYPIRLPPPHFVFAMSDQFFAHFFVSHLILSHPSVPGII